jgi:hypothetical protein
MMPTQGADLMGGVYQTPLNLLTAVNDRWSLGFDLACNASNNAVGRLYAAYKQQLGERNFSERYGFSEDQDALKRDWAAILDVTWVVILG